MFVSKQTYSYNDAVNDVSMYKVSDEIYAYSAFHCDIPSLKERTDPITGEVSDRGDFLIFDAANPAAAANSASIGRSDPIWRLVNQPVKPNTNYTFSVDVLPWPNSGRVQMMLLVGGNTDTQAEPINVSINGSGNVIAGGTVADVTGGCSWSVVSGTWNSGSNTTVSFMVAEVGSERSGHEGAIDNISFNTGLVKETATVELDVNFPPTPNQIEFCTNQSVDLEIGDGKKWNWCEDASCSSIIGTEDGSAVALPNGLKVEGESYVYFAKCRNKPAREIGSNIYSG